MLRVVSWGRGRASASHGGILSAQSISCLIRASSSEFNFLNRMVRERRSTSAAARASDSVWKRFSTPRKPSAITKAEIKRASAIFSDAENDRSATESSESDSEDCASEQFARRRGDPQLDMIRRKLNFHQKSWSTGKKSSELGVGSISSTFQARKLRASEQKCIAVDEVMKREAVGEAQKCDDFEMERGIEIGSGPQTRNGKRQRRNWRDSSDKVIKPEIVEYSVKQETPNESKHVKVPRLRRKSTPVKGVFWSEQEELAELVKKEPGTVEDAVEREIPDEAKEVKAHRPRRRSTSAKGIFWSEQEELAELVKEEPKARVGLRRRKPDAGAGGASSRQESTKRKQVREDVDLSAVKGSSALVLADATNVTPPGTGGDLALESTSMAVSVSVPYRGPYPSYARPYPEECEAARDLLSDVHGHLPEYERHKKSCPTIEPSDSRVIADDSDAHGGPESCVSQLAAVVRVEKVQSEVAVPTGHPRERRTVLDSLVGTLLSQNTTDNNSRRAFASLKRKYPTWEDVYKADPKDVEEAIRCGGLAEIKATRILDILKTLAQERGEMCMEYVRSMSNEEIKTELSRFKGVGPKTVACVLMFHLQRNEFPVDTHVFRISKALGWVPANADREKAYLHLNQRIPDHLKFDIHCLFVTHGKKCPHCTKRQTKKPKDVDCPLVNWSSRVLKSLSKPSVPLLKGSEAD